MLSLACISGTLSGVQGMRLDGDGRGWILIQYADGEVERTRYWVPRFETRILASGLRSLDADPRDLVSGAEKLRLVLLVLLARRNKKQAAVSGLQLDHLKVSRAER